MKISLITNLVFTNMFLEVLSEDMPLKLSDMGLITGLSIIHGMIPGETKELSKLHSENAELIHNVMQEKFELIDLNIQLITY